MSAAYQRLPAGMDWIVGERMGLAVSRETSLAVANKLTALRPSEAE